MRKAILETPFEKAGVRGRSGRKRGSFAAIGAAAMKRVEEYKYDPSKDIGEKEQTGEETMAISRARKMNPANPEYWRKGLGIFKARKLGAKDIKPRKKRIGDPIHPIHRSRIREVYGQDGLDYYDRLIQKQGLSHNEAMGSLEEAHQRHSTGVDTNQEKLFSKLFPVKLPQKEKFKFVVKEKKESEKTPVEKDFDKIRKFQMDRRMVT